MRSCAFVSSEEIEGDEEVVAKSDVVRATFFCFVLARPITTRRLFVFKAVGKQLGHLSAFGYLLHDTIDDMTSEVAEL